MKFKSSVSIFLSAIINLWILAVAFIIVSLVYTGKGYFLLPFLVLFWVYVIHMWYAPAYYLIDVENKNLKVVFGLTRKNYDIEKFRSIRKTSNPLSAPPKGIKRVEISSSEQSVIIISPKDRDKFIEELKRINPNLR